MDSMPHEANIVDLIDERRPAKKKSGHSWTSSDPMKQFGFSANPFADNVNPDFFFRTEGRQIRRPQADFRAVRLHHHLLESRRQVLHQNRPRPSSLDRRLHLSCPESDWQVVENQDRPTWLQWPAERVRPFGTLRSGSVRCSR